MEAYVKTGIDFRHYLSTLLQIGDYWTLFCLQWLTDALVFICIIMIIIIIIEIKNVCAVRTYLSWMCPSVWLVDWNNEGSRDLRNNPWVVVSDHITGLRHARRYSNKDGMLGVSGCL